MGVLDHAYWIPTSVLSIGLIIPQSISSHTSKIIHTQIEQMKLHRCVPCAIVLTTDFFTIEKLVSYKVWKGRFDGVRTNYKWHSFVIESLSHKKLQLAPKHFPQRGFIWIFSVWFGNALNDTKIIPFWAPWRYLVDPHCQNTYIFETLSRGVYVHAVSLDI